MSVLWKDCTTRGAVIGGFLGLISSVVLTVVSPSVWEATLGNPKGSALFPYTSPALFSMTIGFVGIWLFSILDNSARAKTDRAGFLAQQVRSRNRHRRLRRVGPLRRNWRWRSCARTAARSSGLRASASRSLFRSTSDHDGRLRLRRPALRHAQRGAAGAGARHRQPRALRRRRPGADAGDGADPRLPAGRRPRAARGQRAARGHLWRGHAVRRTRAAGGARHQHVDGAGRGDGLADPQGDAAVAAVGQPGLLRRGVCRDRASAVQAGGAQRAARVPVADDGARARRLCAQALLRGRRARPGVGVRADGRRRPEQRAGARRRARRHVHHHRPARRAAAPRRRPGRLPAAAGGGGARRGALRPDQRQRRRRAVRGAAADDPPPRAPRAGARRRGHRRRAEPARPDELRLQPLAHHRAADRAGRMCGRPQGRGAADGRAGVAAAWRRRQGRGHQQHGARAQRAGLRAAVVLRRAGRSGGATAACW